jgi:hypothetical protein
MALAIANGFGVGLDDKPISFEDNGNNSAKHRLTQHHPSPKPTYFMH